MAIVQSRTKDLNPNPLRNLHDAEHGEDFDELVGSVRENGILEPIQYYVLDGKKVIKSGHRRWLAAIALKLDTVPTIGVPAPVDENHRVIDQMILNANRVDLNAIERAEAISGLIRAGMDQAVVAQKLGVSAPTISQTVALLGLTEELKDAVKSGELSPKSGYEATLFSHQDQEQYQNQIIAAKTVRGISKLRHVIKEARAVSADVEPTDIEFPPEEDATIGTIFQIDAALLMLEHLSLNGGRELVVERVVQWLKTKQ